MSDSTKESWPVGWEGVREEQLKTWLQMTPAQRLALMEEMLELARLAGKFPSAESNRGYNDK